MRERQTLAQAARGSKSSSLNCVTGSGKKPPADVVADGTHQAARRVHGDRKPRIRIKHRLAHPIETGARDRSAPFRQRLAARAT